MLQELHVENLLLMERAELRLGPGLNVLTGETGAGKTLLAHALDLLLGGRARRGIVRPGAAEAYVEGVFDLPDELRDGDRMDGRIPDCAEELVLARRVWSDGRTRAYVCGRAATQADLQELGGRLLSFYGQHEHRKLTLSSSQLGLLDAYCGERVQRLVADVRGQHARVRELSGRVAQLRELAGARDRELDLLEFELAEIEAAAPEAGEQEALTAERDRLRHRDELIRSTSSAADALVPEAEGGAAELLAAASGLIEHAAAIDPSLAELGHRLQTLRYEAADVGGELRAYLADDAVAADEPARLEQVEERLALLSRLARKHGGTVEDVLAHADRCRARRVQLQDADDALQRVEAERDEASAWLDELAGRLTSARARAAPKLAAAVRKRLAELAMDGARFELELSPRADGCGPRGADAVEMLIAPNAGGPIAPLRESASGGELSRVMLALLSVAHGSATGGRDEPMLVFDEIDAGIGGHTARAVGEHLRSLAAGRQLLCITHLPQVAALAQQHFTIVKDGTVTPAVTTVAAIEGDEVVAELVRMLGASERDAAASEHARELLRAA
ncbi:MAG TPA: DNA repair protein RecN [Solirubrobacteraceae bacterium]|nr:DNA repair protein RecN [Solirubrobacteraceae bacterium]